MLARRNKHYTQMLSAHTHTHTHKHTHTHTRTQRRSLLPGCVNADLIRIFRGTIYPCFLSWTTAAPASVLWFAQDAAPVAVSLPSVLPSVTAFAAAAAAGGGDGAGWVAALRKILSSPPGESVCASCWVAARQKDL